MIIRKLAIAAALISVTAQAAAAADNWIGAWGYTAMPLPPGVTPAAAIPVTPPPTAPLGAVVPVQQSLMPPAAPPVAPIVENPGNVPLVTSTTAEIGNVTIRQLTRVAAAGKRIRLRFSNEGGTDLLVLGSVHVGKAGADGMVLPGSDRVVTFDGHSGVTIPGGAPVLSDPVDLPVAALDQLAISTYLPGRVARTGHMLWHYVAAAPGDNGAQAQLPGAVLQRLPALVTEIDADPVTAANVVVTLGDSITEGAQSTANGFRGWPDRLAERLAAGGKWSVVNVGIGGNRLLRYGTGPSALARFDRDVLGVPGVKTLILLEGINDIGRSFDIKTDPVTAEALIAADKQIIARAHDHGIRVIGATLTPYEGAHYYDPSGEPVREALNRWILTGGAFDGVIDFAPVVADPAHPTSIRADFNLSDHLHPNDAGYRAMGDAIDLKLVTGGK